ncbi:hypothetical protein CMUS01_16410 [Colletotrichum musicola]|uniref:Uncharacterized protein n=1 Tax=Colletotrichum musicola TaxID=2175873 RepID=A0A8H6INF2_9PEZI|nr:hypothetical protein CMUS01_16410 [Colletotrichum musicola]
MSGRENGRSAAAIGYPPPIRDPLVFPPQPTGLWDDTAHSTGSTDDAGRVGEHVTTAGRSSGSYTHGWRMPP